jgi:hypothetical protein
MVTPQLIPSMALDDWQSIYIRSLDPKMKYSGLLLYAVDEKENKVGEWEIPTQRPFWLPTNAGCDGKAGGGCLARACKHTCTRRTRAHTVMHPPSPPPLCASRQSLSTLQRSLLYLGASS